MACTLAVLGSEGNSLHNDVHLHLRGLQYNLTRMFALRVQRRAGHHAWQRRAYTAVDAVEDGKHRTPTFTPPWSRRFRLEDPDEEDTVGPAQRTVCIRMSRLEGGMVDAFTVIREVERKFGRIREYRFIRVCVLGSFSTPVC